MPVRDRFLLICPVLLLGVLQWLPSCASFLTSKLPAPTLRTFRDDGCQSTFPIEWRTAPDHLGYYSTVVCLDATGSGGTRKRRRRKNQPEATPSEGKKEGLDETEAKVDEDDVENISTIQDVAKFRFERGRETSMAAPDEKMPLSSSDSEAIPLPDIKETLKKKEEEERYRIEEEKLKEKRRIKRSDKEAFTRLLEQQPYADADDSFFEKEEYTTVSALLGEGSKPFLGIPTGPLQVGHFIGSLGIMLMAFIEYPGFPLTNLPIPLRDFLQGGLVVTYTINLVLAVLAALKAGERGQPTFLWVAKTLSVGGLAYDQLTQLPTVEEGKRSKM